MAGLAGALQMRLNRKPARLERLRFAPDVIRGGSVTSSPVIKHPWHVIDTRAALDDSEKQVVVLRAIVLGTETADLMQHLAAHHREVTDIIAGQEKIGRPV